MSKKNILVTGGAGFIGFNIAKILSQNPDNQIWIADNLSKGLRDATFEELISKDNVNFLELDLADQKSWEQMPTDLDQIYFHAAIVGVRKVMAKPVETLRVNSLSTIFMLDFVSQLKNKPKVTFASSCENYAGTVSLYGAKLPTPEEIPLCIEDVFNPRWTYAGSKMLGEMGCIHYSNLYDFPMTVVRYHNVYGARMGYDHVIPHFIERMKVQQSEFDMFGGDQYRTFCYVADAAQMTINLMNSTQANGQVVNVGDDKNHVQIDDLAKMLFKLKGISPKIIEKGAPEGSVKDRIPDLSKLREFNCDVKPTALEIGLKHSLDWYENN